MGRRRAAAGVVALAVTAGSGACQLEEITLVDPEDVVVAEVHVQIFQGDGGETRVTAFLHRTLGPGGESVPVPGAAVAVRHGGSTMELAETGLERCVVTTPVDGTGTCQWAAPFPGTGPVPGDTLTLRIDLPDGGIMESQSVVPGAFGMVAPGGLDACGIPADTTLTLRWTRSEGAWAYINEASLRGIRDALAPRGITVDPDDDPLYLLGLSVAATDTTIVFPAEFGLFNRFELEQDLALSLQRGLPPGVRADVSIAAADRNYVNWVRGGSFNPSGQVRIPSIQGSGTGVFGSTVVRTIELVTPMSDGAAVPACPTL
ncbi:MAG: hypothetical protein RJQ04_13515 [Longimicrobiales bacterium]